ncbi:MAG: hypothetical protein IJY12_00405 [Clostridia bacterium]|nr:hypothetical protein [Clostridia bacterium]
MAFLFLQSFFFVPAVAKKKASNIHCDRHGCLLFGRLLCKIHPIYFYKTYIKQESHRKAAISAL